MCIEVGILERMYLGCQVGPALCQGGVPCLQGPTQVSTVTVAKSPTLPSRVAGARSEVGVQTSLRLLTQVAPFMAHK